MRCPLRHLALTALLAAACAPPAFAAAAAPRLALQWIDVIGRVTGPGGHGLDGVRVMLEGAPDVAVTTDDDGRYTLTVPLEPLGDPARRKVTARVVARRPGWAFTLRNGQGALAIEMRVQARAEPARCRVRSNVPSSVDAMTAAIRRGDRNSVIANVDFVGKEGGSQTSRVALRSDAVTIVGEPNAPELPLPVAEGASETPGTPPAGERHASAAVQLDPGGATDATQRPAPSARKTNPQPRNVSGDSAARRRADQGRTKVRRIDPQNAAPDTAAPAAPEAVTLPGPGVTQTDASLIRRIETSPGSPELGHSPQRPEDALAKAGECSCRIRGTVEIHPDHLLTRRLTLIVALREAPAVRDTIELFMGSPRPFELPALHCGTWHIEVDAVARRDFGIVSADGRGPIDCREGGLRQLRVVLEPN